MISNRELIEKYFDKALTKEEKVLFKEKYDTDPEFKKELKAQAQMIVTLKMMDVQEQEQETEPENETSVAPDSRSGNPERFRFLPLIATIAACAAILIFMHGLYNDKQTELQEKIAMLQDSSKQYVPEDTRFVHPGLSPEQERIILLQDSLEQQKQYIAKLNRGAISPSGKTSINYSTIRPLLTDRTIHDKPRKSGQSETPVLTFTGPDRSLPCKSSTLKIQWTTNRNEQAEIYLIEENAGERKVVSGYPKTIRNVNENEFTLNQLDKDKLYLFEIRTLDKTYTFPFITGE
jgi:hypothetical protein